MSHSFRPHRLAHRLLCQWNCPGKNTGVGCPSLLQGIFPRLGLNPGLLHCRWILYHLSYQINYSLYVCVSCSVLSTLCDPKDCSPPGSSAYGILQARILEWVPFPSPGDLPDPGTKPMSPALWADSLSSESPRKHQGRGVLISSFLQPFTGEQGQIISL